MWVAKLDQQGDTIWDRNLGGSDTDLARDILALNDGTFWVGGSSSSNDHDLQGNYGGLDYWVAYLDSNGDMIWSQNYGGSRFDRLTSLAVFENHGILLAGATGSSDGDVMEAIGADDVWLLALE